MNQELRDAYMATNYIVFACDEFEQFTIRIGEESSELLNLFAAHAVQPALFITGWNPLGDFVGDDQNQAANQRLRELLAPQYPYFAGIGQGTDTDWPGEESFLVLGVARDEAVRLGDEFAQNAVVWCGGSGVGELVESSKFAAC